MSFRDSYEVHLEARRARAALQGELLAGLARAVVERAGAGPMLDQVLGWAAVNSGSRNLAGLERMADLLVEAFSALPGLIRLERPATVQSVDPTGCMIEVEHGRHLVLRVAAQRLDQRDARQRPVAPHVGRKGKQNKRF